MARELRFGLKDVVYIVSTILTFAMSYSTMKNRVDRNEERLDNLIKVVEVLNKMDNRLSLIEFRLNVNNPKTPGGLAQ